MLHFRAAAAPPNDVPPEGVAVEEIARRGVRVQTRRNRIAQALHRVAVPGPRGRRPW